MCSCLNCKAYCDNCYDYTGYDKSCHNSLIISRATSVISSKPIIPAVNTSALIANISEGVNFGANALSSISWISSRVGVWECMAKILI